MPGPGALGDADAPVCSFGKMQLLKLTYRSTPFKRLRLGNSAVF
jgi:hypothetical protein